MDTADSKASLESYSAKNRAVWRRWLAKNHDTMKSVRLVIRHKHSGKSGVTYSEAVEEALCFGWIDSKANKRDAESYYLHFARRKPKSNWSKSNRERVKRLVKEGKMAPAGLAMVELAKRTGTWTALDAVESSVIPDDLQVLFDKNKTALSNFEAFPASSKRIILGWILSAKTEETRSRRIKETVALAAKNIRANQYRPRVRPAHR